MRTYIFTFLILFISAVSALAEDFEDEMMTEKVVEQPRYDAATLPFGHIEPEIARIAYSGGEKFKYDISYTGGVKIGELHLEIKTVSEQEETYEIYARVTTDNGVLDYIYPIKDTHVTLVKGEERLPFHYEIWQNEGRSYKAHKVITYNQKTGKIIKSKNNNPGREFVVEGITHNEFSSFFGSRVMNFELGKPFKIPTFADNKRNEVVVEPIRHTQLEDTVLGTVETIEVTPILTFEGLYDKQGDTVVWYTNDECRVPVLINSKIVIGSLTSKLVSYENPNCRLYDTLSRTEKKTSITSLDHSLY